MPLCSANYLRSGTCWRVCPVRHVANAARSHLGSMPSPPPFLAVAIRSLLLDVCVPVLR